MKLLHLFESQEFDGIYSFHIGTPGQGDGKSDEYYNSKMAPGIEYKKHGYAAAYQSKDYDTLYHFVSTDERVNWQLQKGFSRILYSLFGLDLPNLNNVPSIIDSDFMCRGNDRITSLKDVHKQIKRINAKGHGKGLFDVSYGKLKSNVLGVLLIDGVKEVYFDNKEVTEIINKHLRGGNRDILDCQSELIEAGLEEYAQL